MKQFFVVFFLLFPLLSNAQYFQDTSLEKQFEASNLYFKRHYLNTFGLYNFSRVAPGLFDDSFLGLALNPTWGLSDTLKTLEIYMDYRSDRHLPEITNYPLYQPQYDTRIAIVLPPYPWRYYQTARPEPEPVLSLGLRYKPAQRWQVAGTYQLIYKQEPFYRMPDYIYFSREGYSPFNDRIAFNEENVTVITRQQQGDNLLTRAHLLSAYLAYSITPKLNLGLGTDLVLHQRNGNYLRFNRSPYENENSYTYKNLFNIKRNMDYNHTTFFAGLSYRFSSKIWFGIQVGALNGKANQTYQLTDSSSYSSSSENYASGSFRRHLQDKSFDHQGKQFFSTITLRYRPSSKREVLLFLNYSRLNVDISNQSNITDTSYYRWQNNQALYYYRYLSHYNFFDQRSSTGTQKQNVFEAMLTLKARETEKTKFYFGIYYSYVQTTKNINEPVRLFGNYVFKDESETNGIREGQHLRDEDKVLSWQYDFKQQTVQVPAYWWHKLSDGLACFVILNKLWTAERGKQVTDVFYKYAKIVKDSDVQIKENYVERFLNQSPQQYTKDNTDLAFGFEVALNKKTLLRYTINPDFEPEMQISQWWISFTTRF